MIILDHISVGWTKKRALKFANFDAISQATRQVFLPKSLIPLIIRMIILILIIFSATGFGFWYDGYASDLDYVIAVDASGSMLADDYEPNRLEMAKESAVAFVDLLDAKTNVGVISFAGTSFISQVLTDDKESVKEAIDSIEIINVGGTGIGDAIVLASNVFSISGDQSKGRSLVLLTDGQSNVGIETDDAVDYAVDNGVSINTIGIGTEEGGSFVSGLAISQLDAEKLRGIAEKTGGKFYLIQNKDELELAYTDIFSSTKARVFFDARVYLLIIVFVLLIGEWVLSSTRYKTII
ncbi:MAG: VWA domain-containing protein [Nanoarchaeota archaeon]|nr:VWA domain-containing protein [Nanoarchaeota archaeon]